MKQPFSGVRYLLTENEPSLLGRAEAEVAFVGRSNSGKSSVINAICQSSKLARVSQMPGRTRSIHVYETGHFQWIIDLPGYGFAKGPEHSRQGWKAMIESYLTGRPSLNCVFMIIDAKVGPTPLDFQMADWLNEHQVPFRILANKIDQVKPSQLHGQQKKIAQSLNLPATEISWISATKGTGIPALRQDVAALIGLTS